MFDKITDEELKTIIPEENPGFQYCICKLTSRSKDDNVGDNLYKSCIGFIQFKTNMVGSGIKKMILEKVPLVFEIIKKNNNNNNDNGVGKNKTGHCSNNNNKTLERRNTKKYWTENCTVEMTTMPESTLRSNFLNYDPETEHVVEFGNWIEKNGIRRLASPISGDTFDYGLYFINIEEKLKAYKSWADVLQNEEFKQMNRLFHETLFRIYKETMMKLEQEGILQSLLIVDWHKKLANILKSQPKKNTIWWVLIEPENIIPTQTITLQSELDHVGRGTNPCNNDSENIHSITQFLKYCQKAGHKFIKTNNDYDSTIKKYTNERMIYSILLGNKTDSTTTHKFDLLKQLCNSFSHYYDIYEDHPSNHVVVSELRKSEHINIDKNTNPLESDQKCVRSNSISNGLNSMELDNVHESEKKEYDSKVQKRVLIFSHKVVFSNFEPDPKNLDPSCSITIIQ